MENVEFNKQSFCNSNMSYVELILSILPEEIVSGNLKSSISIIYREYLKNSSYYVVRENDRLSSLVREQLLVDRDEVLKRALEIYQHFLYPSLFFANGRERIFDAMNYSVKVLLSDYTDYSINDDNSYGTRGNLG